MIKVVVNDQVYYYDNATDVYCDYPDAIYINGHFIAYEEERSEEQ